MLILSLLGLLSVSCREDGQRGNEGCPPAPRENPHTHPGHYSQGSEALPQALPHTHPGHYSQGGEALPQALRGDREDRRQRQQQAVPTGMLDIILGMWDLRGVREDDNCSSYRHTLNTA